MKRKFYKLLSIVLSACILLSVCGVSTLLNTMADSKITDYYVGYSTTSDGSGTSKENPVPSIYAAIEKINANGLTAGDTANIWIVQDIAKPEKVESDNAKKPYHNLAYWSPNADSMVPAHEAKIVIKPHADNQATNTSLTTTYLVMGKQVADQGLIILGGSTEFEDIKIVYTSSSNITDVSGSSGQSHIIANGHSMIMGAGVSYGYISHNGNNGDNWKGAIADITSLGIAVAVNGGTYEKPIYLGFKNLWNAHNNAVEIPSLDNQSLSTYTFKEDVTVEVDNEEMYSGYIRVGSFAGGSATFEKNLNFKLTNINRIRFKNGAKNVVVKGGVQFIVPNKQAYDDGYSYTVLTKLVKEDGTTPADLWYLNVDKADMAKIDFANGETGKFKIPSGVQATATPAAGGEAIVSDKGVLDLSGKPGIYTVAFETVVVTEYDYYVEAGGVLFADTDEYGVVGTVDAPYASVVEAIKALKANGTADAEGNTANIYIKQDIAKPEKVPSGTTNKPYHNLAFWGEVNEVVEHNANIIVQPYAENQKINTALTTTYLAMCKQVAEQGIIELGGPTEFRDLKIVYTSSSNVTDVSGSSGKSHIIANGHNLIMNAGVSYGYIAHNGNNGDKWEGAITEIKMVGIAVAQTGATFEKPIYLGFKNYWDAHNNALEIPSLDNKTLNSYTFKEDVTVEVDNEKMYSGYIRFGSFAGGSSTFEKNLNVKLTNINRIRFKKGAKNVVVKGGVQFIVPNNQSYDPGYGYDILTNLVKADGTTPADLWYLNVAKADMAKINFVSGETGKFAIADGYVATATPKAGGNAITSYNGVLDLKGKKGEYTITFAEGGSGTTPPPAANNKMLYFKGNARGPFYQRVENLTPNATYTLKFALSNMSPNFEVVVQTNGNRNPIAATTNLVNADNKGKYTVYEYSVTLPSQITIDNGVETNTAFIGIRFVAQEVIEGYVFDISLKDANNTEMYKNNTFGEGYLDNWAWGWNVWFNSLKYGETKGEWTHNTEGTVYLEVMDFDESKIPDYEPPYVPSQNKKMLYFKGTKRGPLYQRIDYLVPGKTYTFTFEASNNLEGIEVVAHKNTTRTKLDIQSTLVKAENKGRYTAYEYSVTLPSELTVENGVETHTAFIGLIFNADAVAEGGYVSNLSFKIGNSETFENGDFFGGYLDNWAWDWNVWFNSTKYGQYKGTFTHSNQFGATEIYLEVMDFDESKMPVVEPPYVPSQNKKMLYFKGNSRGPFYQRIEDLTPGATYTFTFELSNNVTGVEIAAARNSNRATIVVDSSLTRKTDKGRYTVYEYSVTLPNELTVEGGVETNTAFIGIKFDQTAVDKGAYIANLSFKDATGKELFENKDFFNGYLDHWAWEWNVWFNSTKYGQHKGTFEYANEFGVHTIYLELMDFDESKMKDVESPYIPTPGNKMLYFKGTKRGPLYQRLEDLKPGGTYILTVDASNNITGLTPAAAKNSSRSGLTVVSKYINGVDHGRYTTYTYEVTLPDVLTLDDNNKETYMAFVGVTFSQPSAAEGGYVANLSLKEKISDTKLGEELYKNGDFYKGYLDHWCWEWNVWFNSTKYGQYKGTFTHSNQYGASEIYLEVMDFDESKMPDVRAKLPDYSEKIIYFKNGALTNQFAAWVDSKPGMQYVIKYSVFSTEEITPALNANGLRGRLAGNPQLLNKVEGDNYTTYTYKVTVPADYTDDLVFLGVSMPYYAEGYLFDLEAYRADDSDKKPIWDNPNFVKGFDDWTWGWTVTWFSKEGTGNLTEWEDATHKIKIYKKDLSLIQTLIDDIYRNDGEWWNPEDVDEEKEVKGTANVTGTFKDHNGNPVAGLKLIFKSEENKYTATTDSKGNFAFNKVIEGYYELYMVNAKGEEVLSEFYCTLAAGDTLTINIVTDTTKEEEFGTLKGAVYTPQLKTVANIKLYLRGVAETTTDANGAFDFGEVKVGKYDLYTILEDGSEYIFRTIEIKENTDLSVKLKYDVGTSTDVVEPEQDTEEGFNWIWIVIACGAVVVVAAGAVLFVVLKKKKARK